MLEFASALYLGFRHGSAELRGWPAFTAGFPAALGAPRLARRIAAAFASLQGCEAATLAASTLHLFWDLFRVLADRGSALLLDGGTYPIARWGAERVAAHGVPVLGFRHYDLVSLRQRLETIRAQGRRPIVVADGFCPSCGRAAPMAGLVDVTRRFGGLLVIDDTQALGIFGHAAGPDAPYGKGGGGMLRYANVTGPDVLVASSTAKALGVPLAVLAGSRAVVDRFESRSETRVHCSPPSFATLRAAEHALALNETDGDAARLRLASLVRRFRSRAAGAALPLEGSLFPVQSFAALPGSTLFAVHEDLLRRGVRAAITRSREDAAPRLSFLVTARHTTDEIEIAAAQLAGAVRAAGRSVSRVE